MNNQIKILTHLSRSSRLLVLTLTTQLHFSPQTSVSHVELDGVFAHVLLRGLRDLQPQLLSHHAALDAVREGDGRISDRHERLRLEPRPPQGQRYC